jgi:hypothetical protein
MITAKPAIKIIDETIPVKNVPTIAPKNEPQKFFIFYNYKYLV